MFVVVVSANVVAASVDDDDVAIRYLPFATCYVLLMLSVVVAIWYLLSITVVISCCCYLIFDICYLLYAICFLNMQSAISYMLFCSNCCGYLFIYLSMSSVRPLSISVSL